MLEMIIKACCVLVFVVCFLGTGRGGGGGLVFTFAK